jgi:hypothetical protein
MKKGKLFSDFCDNPLPTLKGVQEPCIYFSGTHWNGRMLIIRY